MDIRKQMEMVRKRNAELSSQLEEAKSQLENFSSETPNELIDKLLLMQKEWKELIEILKDKNAEYELLIGELRDIKKTMTDMRLMKNIYEQKD